MPQNRVGTREEWLQARLELLKAEKHHGAGSCRRRGASRALVTREQRATGRAGTRRT